MSTETLSKSAITTTSEQQVVPVETTPGTTLGFRLSDAIRRGAKLVPGQARTWVQADGTRCALGAAVKVAEDAGVL